ncbi:LysE family translocator [Variovorax sp. H27-G14]|uniref:LysE family translocator n=1 Tax=Variovorax sp. H27-G14 TaxID=3111914 RepID=UPI0038FD0A3C
MTLELIIALFIFLTPLVNSPGPGNSFYMALGASKGFAGTLPSLIGYHVATFIVTLIIGFGVGMAFLSNPIISKALQIFGSVYVAWIGVLFLREALSNDSSGVEESESRSAGFFGGAFLLLTNPKAYYVIAAMCTQFIVPGAEKNSNVLVLTSIFTLYNFVAFGVWSFLGSQLTKIFLDKNSRKWFYLVSSACMFGVAAWILFR